MIYTLLRYWYSFQTRTASSQRSRNACLRGSQDSFEALLCRETACLEKNDPKAEPFSAGCCVGHLSAPAKIAASRRRSSLGHQSTCQTWYLFAALNKKRVPAVVSVVSFEFYSVSTTSQFYVTVLCSLTAEWILRHLYFSFNVINRGGFVLEHGLGCTSIQKHRECK